MIYGFNDDKTKANISELIENKGKTDNFSVNLNTGQYYTNTLPNSAGLADNDLVVITFRRNRASIIEGMSATFTNGGIKALMAARTSSTQQWVWVNIGVGYEPSGSVLYFGLRIDTYTQTANGISLKIAPVVVNSSGAEVSESVISVGIITIRTQ